MNLFIIMAASLALAQDTEKPDLRPGLLGEYFDFGEEIDDFPYLGDRKPDKRVVDPRVDFAEVEGDFGQTSLVDHFAVRWTGVIRIPKDGRYTFKIESDDGSKLRIDGKLVVDNGGIHGILALSGKVDLKAGDHPIRIDFFDNDRGAACRLSWGSAEAPLEVVPTGALFHPKDKELDK